MKYGQIAGSKRVNAAIYLCFNLLKEQDQRRFVRKFHEQPHNSAQVMHTFRELILGAYLCSFNVQVTYELKVEGKAPDWGILDCTEKLSGIVELVNFHIDQQTEKEIEEQLNNGGISRAYWRDGNKDNVQRLYSSMRRKIVEYSNLVKKLKVPYVIAVFPDFFSSIDFEEVLQCVESESGLFMQYQELSGVLFFEEHAGVYYFRYASNPNAVLKITLADGILNLQAD